MDIINNINNIFKNITYENVNKYGNIKLRHIKGGLSLRDAILFNFLYTQKNVTKQNIVSNLNFINDSTFYINAYRKKEEHISCDFYNSILNELLVLSNKINDNNNLKYVAIDGSSSITKDFKVALNMGYYDINNNIPLNLTFNGHENRNKEIKCFIEHIENNKNDFKNVVFVMDRFYHSYELITFLTDNNYKFIIRGKGKCDISTLHKIQKIDVNTKILHFTQKIEKNEQFRKGKKDKIKSIEYEIINDCHLITNLNKIKKEKVLDLYRKRREIEIFFKFIKHNFKFQSINNDNSIDKMYITEMILIYLQRLFIHIYNKLNNAQLTIKNLNNTNLLKGIYDSLIKKIINGELTNIDLKKYFTSYLIVTKNKENRKIPRISKTPFTKWYVKEYSNSSKLANILEAIINKTIDKLDKNLKIIANRITILKVT